MNEATALLLVDVINDFFSEKGSNYYPAVGETVEPLRRLLATARERDTLVIHAVERHRPGLDDFEQKVLPEHCLSDGFDAEFYPGFEPVQRNREVVVPKRRYSAFFSTDLDLLLREQQVSKLVVGGVKTNVCIRASIQDAFGCGYRVLLPHAATNSNRPHLGAASLEDIGRYFGRVVDLDEALETL